MQPIAEWLDELGLGQYAQRFADNDIDANILRDLTDGDLEKIGVSLGHRKRMLRAIAELDRDALSAEPTWPDEAQRRQLTVMFCDLVGSTPLSTRLDPEELREIIGVFHRCCAEQIAKCSGVVARYMGDGMLVYFGFPRAHEDDAERAVRAGLALVGAVAQLGDGSGMALQVRVGIATGLVVVGDLLGEGAAQEHQAVGETPNLAARLQGLAEPNAVVIDGNTRCLLGELFEYRAFGSVFLKGFGTPVPVWQVTGRSAVDSRFEALRTTRTPLVGRDEEIDLLMRRWEQAKGGEGCVVVISGEPGIGKSRLTVALLERLTAEPHTRFRYFCSPQHTDSALFPIIGQMQRAARLAYDEAPGARLDKLDALLAQSSTSTEDVGLIAEMLSLPNDGRYPALDLAPQQRRQRTLEALVSQLEALTRSNPVLMIFEDAHWSDPTSLEMFSRTVDRMRTLRVLLIVTFRPEFDPPWVGRPYVTALTINRLAEREVGAMIDRLVGNKLIPASIRQDIIERTDGIPLFIEEMTKAVLEADSQHAAERAIAAVPSPALAVPASLHASLMARLDRLGPARKVAQVGAAIGREFSHALLAAVVRKPEVELGSALDRLVASGLLFRLGVPPYATYLFKHALVQDAAYGTLLRERRRELHARITETLESQFTEIAESQPELLARHCTAAGLIEKAAGLWGKAGQRSLGRSAYVEAVEQLARALAQIATLPATSALRRDQIKLQVALITPLMHVKGYAALETKAAAEQARRLIEQAEALGEPPEDPLLPFSVLYGFWGVTHVAFNGNEVRKLAAQFFTLAEKQGSTVPLMMSHRIMGITKVLTGSVADALAHFDQSLRLYDPAEHRSLATRFGADTRVTVLCWRALASWVLGYPEKALADTDHALKEAREVRQAATLMLALRFASTPHIFCGNYATANALLHELIALADEKGASLWKASGVSDKGFLLALSGKAPDAVQMITCGITARRSAGATQWMPWYFSCLARVYAELGQFDDAWRSIGDAMTTVETTKESWYEAEVNRISGEVALKSPVPDAAKAEAYFERALAIAREQQAKSWELRAATSMARLWRDQGRRQPAHDLLAPVYGWFTQGFNTLDLEQAKALLDDLAQ